MLHLPELQREFFDVISRADEGATEPSPALLADVRGDVRLGARARLDVYARMYRTRLVDVLLEDYPRVAALLGRDAFRRLTEDYARVHPSTHPSLRWFGRRFGEFLGARAGDLPAFVPDLARLEWARLAAFDAPDVGLLDVAALRRMPPEAWTTLRLRLAPCVALLHVDWPVHRIWESDDAATNASCPPRPDELWLRVWRQGDKVYQASLDAAERTALAHVQAGHDFAEVCEGVATIVGAETAAPTAGALVLRWIEDGLLVADGPPS